MSLDKSKKVQYVTKIIGHQGNGNNKTWLGEVSETLSKVCKVNDKAAHLRHHEKIKSLGFDLLEMIALR